MDYQICGRCANYRQHYAFDQRSIFRVYCGHCTLGRMKRKKPDASGCDQYIPGQLDEEAFVRKEYLSKELLQYVLKLELLPQIREGQE